MDDDDDDDDGRGRGGLERLIAEDAIDRLDLRPGAHGPPDSEWLCRVLRPLRTNRSVSSLDVWGALREQSGGGRALAHLHAALRRPDGALCAVDVGANALGDERCAQLAGAMAEGAAAGAPLQRVVLSSNALTDASAPALAALIAGGSCLQILELKSNKLGNAAAAALGKPLARNPPLTSLSLAHNSVEAKGAAALLGAMAENTTLRSLDLRNNLLGGSSGPGGKLQAQLEARCRLNEQRSTVANPVPATSVANPPPRPASRLATARGGYLEYSTDSEQPSAAGLHVSTQQAMPRRGGGSSVGASSRQHSERRAAHSWHGQRADLRAAREGSHSAAEVPQDHAWKSNVDAWVEEQSGAHSDPGREEEEEDSPSPRQRWARRMSSHRGPAKPRREMSPSLDDAEQAWRDLELARHEVHERRQKLSFVSRTILWGSGLRLPQIPAIILRTGARAGTDTARDAGDARAATRRGQDCPGVGPAAGSGDGADQ